MLPIPTGLFQQHQQQQSRRQTVLFAWVDNSHVAVPVCVRVRALGCVCVRNHLAPNGGERAHGECE